MKCARLSGPQRIEVRDVDDPRAPSDGVVLQMEACGVCGSDLRRWKEGPPAGVTHLVQGHELSGVVLEVGSAVTGFQGGERLAVAPDIHCGRCYYCRHDWVNLCTDLRLLGITPGLDGGFAERVVLPGELLRHGIVHRLPAQATFFDGALAETLSSVIAAQEQCRTAAGETVVVLGAGPIGCLHLVVARGLGARVVVAEPNPARRRIAARFEPLDVLDPSAQDVVAEVQRLTDGLGADVVICANPVAATHAVAVEMARRRGRIVLFGGLPKAEPMTRLNANLIHYGEQVVMGAFSYHPRHHAEALAMLARQQVRADQFVTHVQTLSRVAEAFATAAAGEALKVMVVPDRAIPGEALDRITARYLEERLEASPSMRPPRGGPRRK